MAMLSFPGTESISFMLGLSLQDLLSLGYFISAWMIYHWVVEANLSPRRSLNSIMNAHRMHWMEQMSERESRIVDANIMGSLQNGTAFFASTSLIAIGAAATLLRSTDDVLRVFGELPFSSAPTRGLWELKVAGLIVIFGYAFFKFAWAYRLFNFTAMLIGATPAARSDDAVARKNAALRAGRMNTVAAAHFTRGQRAFFFALAYIGWFAGSYVFLGSTTAVLIVMWGRQHASDARGALEPFDEIDTKG